jgi:O-antigen/teichoic acid export membrane protein
VNPFASSVKTSDSSRAGETFRGLTQVSLVFALGAIAGKAIGLLMLPILARALTPNDLGRVDLLTTLGSGLISTLLLGVDISALRLSVAAEGAERAAVFSTWYLLAAATSLPVAIALVVLAPQIGQFLFGASSDSSAVALVGAVLLGGTLHVVALGILRATGRAVAYAVVSAGALAINAVVAIIFLAAWRQDATAVLAALAIAWWVSAIVGGLAVRPHARALPRLTTASRLVRLGLPAAPAIALPWFGEVMNRGVLLGAGGSDEVGFLSVAIRFGSVATLAVVAFQLAWQPRAYRDAESHGGFDRLARDARSILLVVTGVSVAVAAAAPELLELVAGSAYAAALPAVGLSLVAPVFAAVLMVESTVAMVAKHAAHLGVGAVIAAVVSIAVNVVLAPIMGATGTAFAIVSGQLVGALSVGALNRRRSPVSAAFARAAPWLAAAVVFVLLATAQPSLSLPVRLVVGAALLLAIAGRILLTEFGPRSLSR